MARVCLANSSLTFVSFWVFFLEPSPSPAPVVAALRRHFSETREFGVNAGLRAEAARLRRMSIKARERAEERRAAEEARSELGSVQQQLSEAMAEREALGSTVRELRAEVEAKEREVSQLTADLQAAILQGIERSINNKGLFK